MDHVDHRLLPRCHNRHHRQGLAAVSSVGASLSLMTASVPVLGGSFAIVLGCSLAVAGSVAFHGDFRPVYQSIDRCNVENVKRFNLDGRKTGIFGEHKLGKALIDIKKFAGSNI